jgi:type II secretory pathway component PulF
MLDAGLSAERALSALARHEQDQDVVTRLVRRVRRGAPLAPALRQESIITQFEFGLLSVAEASGKLPKGLRFLAEQTSARDRRTAKLKAQFLLPQLILAVACCAAFFIRVARGEPLLESFWIILLPALGIWCCARILIILVSISGAHYLSLVWSSALARRYFYWVQQLFAEYFYRGLVWQLGAGISPQQALTRCTDLLASGTYKQSAKSASNAASTGETLPTILLNHDLILTADWLHVWQTALSTGDWEGTVSHHLELQRKDFAVHIDTCLSWLPRFYYVAVLVLFARQLT